MSTCGWMKRLDGSENMRFACIGTCVGGNILWKAKDRGLNWSNVCNIVSYSHFALCDRKLSSEFLNFWQTAGDYPSGDFLDEPPNNISRLESAISMSVYERIKQTNPDYILIDLTDFRLGEYLIDLGKYGQIAFGCNFLKKDNLKRLTSYLEELLNIKTKLSTISIGSLSDEELDTYIKRHIDNLIEYFGEERLVFFKQKLVCNYLDKDEIKYTPSFYVQNDTNDIIYRIYSIAGKYISYIDTPWPLIGDISCTKPFEYHYCSAYYDYMIDCIEYIVNGGHAHDEYIKTLHNEASVKCRHMIESVFSQQIIGRLTRLSLLDKRIVLLDSDKYFDELLFDEKQIHIHDWIYYDRDSDLDEIEATIKNLTRNSEDRLVFVAQSLFYHEKRRSLFTVFFNCGLVKEKDWFTYNRTQNFNPFQGSFHDVFDNCVTLRSKLVKLKTVGVANRVSVGTRFSEISLICEDGGTLEIGSSGRRFAGLCRALADSIVKIGDETSGSNIDLCAHMGAKIDIGDDVMFSIGCMVYAGDGHSIFDLSQIGDIVRKNLPKDSEIVIGNHVWVGFGAKILRGTIGDGSIIGAGSIVNKSIGRNCIAAGVPAKVIKKNMGWSRNNWILSLNQDSKAYAYYEEYIDTE